MTILPSILELIFLFRKKPWDIPYQEGSFSDDPDALDDPEAEFFLGGHPMKSG